MRFSIGTDCAGRVQNRTVDYPSTDHPTRNARLELSFADLADLEAEAARNPPRVQLHIARLCRLPSVRIGEGRLAVADEGRQCRKCGSMIVSTKVIMDTIANVGRRGSWPVAWRGPGGSSGRLIANGRSSQRASNLARLRGGRSAAPWRQRQSPVHVAAAAGRDQVGRLSGATATLAGNDCGGESVGCSCRHIRTCWTDEDRSWRRRMDHRRHGC
jgi:hypothetical protein